MPKHRLLSYMLICLCLLSATAKPRAQAAGVSPDSIRVEDILSEMTLAEKVGQLFIVDLARLDNMNQVTALTPAIAEKLSHFRFGGVILFAQNLTTKDQITQLICAIRQTEKIPLFICIDEEGGRISRLEQTPALKLEQLPSAESIGKRGSRDYAYQVGTTLAAQLKEFGFNVDFAPVLDINTNPANRVIGDRSFGKNPELVTSMGLALMQGLQDNQIMACGKHFPGHGDTSVDTHIALAVSEHDLDRLRREEFRPFAAAIENGVMSIMLAHIAVPQVTGDDLPATMSPVIATTILRDELGFNGLIITDALMMQAITDHYTPAQACLLALEAGVDLLLMPDNIADAYTAVLHKTATDPDFALHVDQKVRRIIRAKLQLGLFD